MRSVEVLELCANLVQRARELTQEIEVDDLPTPGLRAKVLGLTVQADIVEQQYRDAVILLRGA